MLLYRTTMVSDDLQLLLMLFRTSTTNWLSGIFNERHNVSLF